MQHVPIRVILSNSCLISLALFLFSLPKSVSAQENTEDNSVQNIFSHSILINAQTTETVEKRAFEFRIQHRFGEMDFNESKNTILQDFVGLDGSANIRLSLAFGLLKNLQIGIGRTKIDKVVDVDAKYRLLRQKNQVAQYLQQLISILPYPP